MEVICRVWKIGVLTQRTFTSRDNQQQVVNEREIGISCGASKFFGVMQGSVAATLNENDGEWYEVPCVCNFDITSRTYSSDKGESIFTNVRINKLEKI